MTPEYFRNRAAVLLAGLRKRFQELECRDFPTNTPSEALKQIGVLLTRIEGGLSAADERTAKLVIKVLSEYQKLLAIFDNAHSAQTPRGLVRVLEELLIRHGIYGATCKLIAAPQPTYNYTIQDLTLKITGPIRNYFAQQQHEELCKLFPIPIFLVAFPRMERDNTLIHAVFGHEVGHIVAHKFLEEETKDPGFAQELHKTLEPIRQSISAQSGQDQAKLLAKLQQQEVLVRWYWRRGLEELISDYVGLLLFGPSALFAYYAIFSPSDLDAKPQTPDFYPPSRYRLRFGLRTMQEDGFIDAFRKLSAASTDRRINAFPAVVHWFEQLEELTRSEPDLSILNQDPACKAAFDWITRTLPKAKEHAKNQIKAILYTSDRVDAEVAELVERISLDLPPNEIGPWDTRKSVGWASAILAGWCYTINGKAMTGAQSRDLVEHGHRS